ncbi:MAG TPA: GNAT family N-acetyltransferase [Thermoanaerobaculia bacterium]|nr:GNAT family N-acetyltransferase [Thermoanaerobaculia bacterium]
MKGQKLFVRRILVSDWSEIRHLDSGIDTARAEGELAGFLGKLAGDVVAFALTREAETQLTIQKIFVSQPLRRKRAGTIFMREIERLAAVEGLTELAVANDCYAAGFFTSTGFDATTLTKKIAGRAEERES